MVCSDANCTGYTLDIIKDACADDTLLSTHMSNPLSTSTEVNSYINTINSDYSFQLTELTLFQFPNNPESKFYLTKLEFFPISKSEMVIFSNDLLRCFSNTKAGC